MMTGLNSGSLIDFMIIDYIDRHINSLKEYESWKEFSNFLNRFDKEIERGFNYEQIKEKV